MIAYITDKNAYAQPVSHYIISYSYPPTSNKHIIIKRVYYSKVGSGEVSFVEGTFLPFDVVETENKREIIKLLINDFRDQ